MISSAKPVRVAIIGVSGYGRIHLQLARESQERGEISLVAATIINPHEEREAVIWLEGQGAKIFASYERMLEEFRGQIDLCLIPTGIHWHACMTLAALAAGANVLVEKPLAASMAEVEAIQALEKSTGLFVAVGFQDLYEPGTLWLQDELARGAIGRIESIRFLGVWPRARGYYQRNDWAGRLQVGSSPVMDSPLNNAFAHFVMLSLFFLGEESVRDGLELAEVELLRAHAIESFDTAVVRARSRSGVDLWFGASHACHQTEEPEIVIRGSLGQAVWRYENEAWWQASGAPVRQRLADITGARRAMFSATLARLRDPSTRLCGTALASLHTRLIEAIHHRAQITSVADGRIEWSGPNGDASQIPSIVGLQSALRRAYDQQLSLTTVGLPPSSLVL